MAKFRISRLIFPTIILLSILVFSASCGTLNVNLHTTLESSGDVTQKITFNATGALGTSMSNSVASEDMAKEGWDVTTSQKGDTFTLEAVKKFGKDEPMSLGSAAGEPMNLTNTKYTRDNSLLVKSYRFETTLQGTPDLNLGTDVIPGASSVNPQQMEALIASMFSMSWSITLPGNITKTNADKVEGNTGTWNIPFSSLQKDRAILIESSYTNWPVIGGIIAGALIVIGLIAFLLIRARRPQYTSPPAAPQTPLTP